MSQVLCFLGRCIFRIRRDPNYSCTLNLNELADDTFDNEEGCNVQRAKQISSIGRTGMRLLGAGAARAGSGVSFSSVLLGTSMEITRAYRRACDF